MGQFLSVIADISKTSTNDGMQARIFPSGIPVIYGLMVDVPNTQSLSDFRLRFCLRISGTFDLTETLQK